MPHPVLPELDQANKILPDPNSAGQWDSRAPIALEQLSQSLNIQTVHADINSIPDIWARPLLFEMALYKDTHLLHEQILGEWRGLLAMFALRQHLKLNQLSAVRLDFAQYQNIEPDDIFRRFAPASHKLVPRKSLASDASWKFLYIFLWGDRAIGITSPTTYVATSIDYHDVIDSRAVRWFDGRRLHDPSKPLPNTNSEVLSSGLKSQLAGWIDNLRREFTNYNPKNRLPEWTLLDGLLQAFQNDLGTADQLTLVDSDLNIEGDQAKFFSFLDLTCKGVGGGENDLVNSNVLLIHTTPGRQPSRRILVTDSEIAGQWHMQNQQITIAGTTTLDLATPPETISSNRNRITNAAEEWKSSEFFTDKLFLLQGEALPKAMSGIISGWNNEVTPIIPIKSVVAEQITASEIATRISYKVKNGNIEVSLRLPLKGTDGNIRDYKATKVYESSNIINLFSLPALEIFPNFKNPNWKAYYTCYSTNDLTETFQVIPFINSMMINDGTEDVAPETTTPEPISIPMSSGSAKRCVWRTKVFPELFLCRASFPNPNTGQNEEVDAGIISIKEPELQPAPGVAIAANPFHLGIDFGASGTNLYSRFSQGGAPSPINFNKRLHSITAIDASDRAELYSYFLPDDNLATPYLSVYHHFANRVKNPDGISPFEAILNGHIYFFSDYDKFNARGTNMKINLKWSDEPEDREMIGAFLLQACLQAAAEAVSQGASQMQITYSYPTSFSTEQIGELRGIWARVRTSCEQLTGLTIAPPAEETESIAAARFFLNHGDLDAPLYTGSIIVDIGSSTSDISFWGNNQPIRQMSLRLAGGNLFLSYLWHHPNFLEEEFQLPSKTLVEHQRAKAGDAFNAQANALLHLKNSYIFDRLAMVSGRQSVRKLKQHLCLGLSGIFYYLGLNVRHLIAENQFNPQTPDIFLGGNGSRMFRWFDASTEIYDDTRILGSFFKEIFLHAANLPIPSAPVSNEDQNTESTAEESNVAPVLDDNFTLQSSPLPKAEAAYGLVCEGLDNVQAAPVVIIAGEEFRRNGTTYSWNTILDGAILSEGIEPTNGLAQLRDFLDTFNNLAANDAVDTLNEGDLESLLNKTFDNLTQVVNDQFRGKVEGSIHVEPLFILAIKEFLRLHLR